MDKDKRQASMDPWMKAEIDGEEVLFGFAGEHAVTGGGSWVRSSPLVGFDAKSRRAETLSGRLYALGRSIDVEDLDEEGRAAYEILVERPDSTRPEDLASIRWLTCHKAARHLGLEPPARDPSAVEAFLAANGPAYERARGFKPKLH